MVNFICYVIRVNGVLQYVFELKYMLYFVTYWNDLIVSATL